MTDYELYYGLLNEVKEGRVRMFRHPVYTDIVGFNYNETCQFEKAWNSYNRLARGLCFLEPNKYFENPRRLNNVFPKIFNIEETSITQERLQEELNSGNVWNISDKHDGSLIIVFHHPYLDEYIVMTRGSFVSEQAQLAKELFEKNPAKIGYLDCSTMLYELVGPSNKNVCRTRYKVDELITIGFGTSYLVCGNTDNCIQEMLDDLDLKTVHDNPDPNNEGIVIEFLNSVDGHQFVKVKSELYRKLHKVLTGEFTVSRLMEIWGASKEGSRLDLEGIPDEFFSEINQYLSKIDIEYSKFAGESCFKADQLSWLSKDLTRKEIAIEYPESTWLLSWHYGERDSKQLEQLILKRFIKKVLEGELCQNLIK